MTGVQILLIVLIALVVLHTCVRAVAISVVPRNRRPSSALAWLLAIAVVPVVGVGLYLLIGSDKLPPNRRAKQVAASAFIRGWTSSHAVTSAEVTEPAWFGRVVELNQNLSALPLVSGNSAHLIGDYAASIAAMTEAVHDARSFVHCQFYILALDSVTTGFFDAMQAAVARGVAVRVLLDYIASTGTSTHRQTIAWLNRIGVEWAFMLPVRPLRGQWQRPDLRNHRKLLVVDDRVAFMGSQNLIARTYNKRSNLRRGLQWQDLMTRVTGPTVRAINAVFLTDWHVETGSVADTGNDRSETASAGDLDCQVVPSGPGFDGENNLQMFLALLYAAERRIIITSPYFVPDEAMLLAISGACNRGVEVQLFVSEIGDQAGVFHAQRSYYEALLRAGVQIWMYPAPYILHAKHLSIDDSVAVIGSSNMDIRSFGLDLEISLLVRGESLVTELRGVEDGYRAISSRLTLEIWLKEPRGQIIRDNIARLTSALQ